MLNSLRRGAVLAALLLVTVAASAAGPGAVRKQAEMGMQLSGQIDIAPDGSVEAVRLDQQDRLSAELARFVRSSVMGWAFVPVVRDGKPVAARSPLMLRLVGRQLEDGSTQVAIRSATFAAYDPESRSAVTALKMTPPSYPRAMYEVGAQGNVYLVLKVGRDGRVADAYVEQVNMTVVASEGQMRRFRQVLGGNALAAARKWEFRVPVEGEDADAPHWNVRMPVRYAMVDQGRSLPDEYGTWQAYIPGPRERAPWISDEDWENGSDALADGGVYMAGRGGGPKLLTPLEG
ncbi:MULTISPECIES: energy transducer TonB [Stenotrophomonas]|uniref:energy transducer TonB n=1 Tax=Stenotrophomonas TaxID=40323 RepID=UPI001CF2049F|nr:MULTISPECIES: energy transducer TonB [Stenotrophomonas]MCA7025009.1 energy transducer TonB [Stenotrophomonas acidaminiphila]MCE4076783.1 energy transducer TonB [Stenotrophomonas acidaminiphila]